MTKKPRLTDLQLVLLSSAAQRPDGMLLPPPETIRAKGKTLERSLTKMLGLGLIEECPAGGPDQAWCNDVDGRQIALRIAAAGRAALGLDEEPAATIDPASQKGTANEDTPERAVTDEADTAPEVPPARRGVKPGTKQARLVDHLSRPSGASIADLGGLLGWQPHTVRAALTGLRKKGYQITNAKDATGVSVYRATAPVEVIDDAA